MVFGATPAGVCAAIGAARDGAKVRLVEPTAHVGGVNTGGLCFSDSDQMWRAALGGLFEEFHLRIERDYVRRGVKLPYSVSVKTQVPWTYEHRVAARVVRERNARTCSCRLPCRRRTWRTVRSASNPPG